MFRRIEALNFPEIEHRILKLWEKKRFFDKLREKLKGRKKFSFLDGPITANNPMGVHHAWGRTYKDLFQRYKAMRGFDQRFQNGFDCQGLWVEVEVERELGFNSKREIERYGIAKFIEKCKERVLKYSKLQTQQSIRLGQWMDWKNSYYTMSDENNYHIWYFLKKCYENGWVYKGKDVMPWCPRCGTALSEHEIVTEGYKEITHPGLYLKFPLKEGEYLLVWTTTPWTLTSNVAVAVHPELLYVKIEMKGEIYYLAKNRLGVLEGENKVLREFTGKELIGLQYRGPFDELPVQKGIVHKVIPWEEVSEEEGTGLVHIAPGCGREDFALSKEYNLPIIAPLDEEGVFLDGFDWLSGKKVSEVNKSIFEDLKKKGVLYKIEDYTHRYPVCWRCGSELVFRLVDEWFISMKKLRYRIMESAKQVRWMPEFGLERELDWLRNMEDWCISKKRYWGLALPIYECKRCGNFEVIGSKEELKERAVEGWEEFEGHSPHRPWIDKVKINCPKCGAVMSRIPDVGNPWLDAGIVPFSTLNYLRDRKYWEEWFPFDFITECFPGQFRNWFYAILTMSTVLENRAPFKTLLGHALVKDEKGEDMHKSKGNVIWFDEAAERMGADVMRWIFISQNPAQNLNFGYSLGREVKRKFLTLWNVYSFFITYAIIDGFKPEQNLRNKDRSLLDRWILSRLQGLIEFTIKNLDDYNPAPVVKEIEKFIDDLSLWYVRRSRRRFWKSKEDEDKWTAYSTLYECLVSLSKLLAPFMPFLSEELYQNLVVSVDREAPESVHLCDYPEPDPKLKDEKLEELIEATRHIVYLGRAAREKVRIKVRQPLSRIEVKLPNSIQKEELQLTEDMIKEELNIKEIFYKEEIEAREGFMIEEEGGYKIALDTNLTDELIKEGFAREIVHKIQLLRKEAGFEVTDRIKLFYEATPKIEGAIQRYKNYISQEILCVGMDRFREGGDITKELKFDGEIMRLTLQRIVI